MEKLKFEGYVIGPGLFTHNYLCAVCQKESAVYSMNDGVLWPCWGCQDKGFHLVKCGSVLTWILRKIGVVCGN